MIENAMIAVQDRLLELLPEKIAYLAEEVEPASLGSAMGIYIGATALGGMNVNF